MTKSETDSIPRREDAVRRAAEAEANLYIVTPASPWGGTTSVIGPLTQDQARERLDAWLPVQMPEGPPKLLRLVEDYGPPEAPPRCAQCMERTDGDGRHLSTGDVACAPAGATPQDRAAVPPEA